MILAARASTLHPVCNSLSLSLGHSVTDGLGPSVHR